MRDLFIMILWVNRCKFRMEGSDFMGVIYLLQHTYRDKNHEDTKYIGLFSDKEKVNEVIEKLKEKPGFEKFPDGFLVSEMILDKIYWEKCFFDIDLDCS